MLTLGDVFSVVAILTGLAFCLWALLVAASLVFDRKVEKAGTAVRSSPWRCLFAGAFWLVLGGGCSLVLLNLPSPAMKAAGTVGLAFFLGVIGLGCAGLVGIAAQRVRALDEGGSDYAALSRGALFVVLPGFLPILGWFGIAPALILLGLGAGMKAILAREAVASEAA
jgi:hypothetical protein